MAEQEGGEKANTPPLLGHVLVTGGSGFLGHHIVSLLSSRKACDKLTSLDLRAAPKPVAGVQYEQGDITDYDAMLKLLGRLQPTAVIHTASPNAMNRLGYKPVVKLEEGIRRGVRDALFRGVVVGQPPELKGKLVEVE
ncbi:erg26, C-3 sterol dehydrogenase [Friedmanniomyces endolithicus]|nr:erg26, C-3 sterol dehydrogenase [Friedmanniomyces endolithicus]